MILNYKTGQLPPNFIYLGIMFLGISIWRMLLLDSMGILFFIISLLFLFIKSGILIDVEGKRLKKYIGFLGIKKGGWESVEPILNLQIIKTRRTRNMSVLSMSRTEIEEIYKLLIILADGKIELMSGKRNKIFDRAEQIATSLGVSVKDNTQ